MRQGHPREVCEYRVTFLLLAILGAYIVCAWLLRYFEAWEGYSRR